MIKDCGFPIIKYEKGKSYRDWGRSHGEGFKSQIQDLAQIRKELMLNKNPSLKDSLDNLALKQWQCSKDFNQNIWEELDGIREGSNLSITDIVILNNYTDFRDIQLQDEGCTTIHINQDEKISAQTWDMHSSAKNFVSVIEIPSIDDKPSAISFSLVGCVGMMGINNDECFIGVNNVNTLKAKTGIIWPVLVRSALQKSNAQEMIDLISNATVTSGHNYLISDSKIGINIEKCPEALDLLPSIKHAEKGRIFHTNHCLGKHNISLEDKTSISSTTHARMDILEQKIAMINNGKDVYRLLNSHDGYPKSICSHYESGAQDPAMTCGGAQYNYNLKQFNIWRGCQEKDQNARHYQYQLINNTWEKSPIIG